MAVVSEDFSSYVRATTAMFNSDDVTRVLNSLNDLSLTPGDLKGEEPELKRTLEVEKNGILRELEVTEKLSSDIRKVDSDYQNLVKKVHAVGVSIEEKREEKIPCKEDEETLRKMRKTLRLYKDITNIRWDYSAPENLIKGCEIEWKLYMTALEEISQLPQYYDLLYNGFTYYNVFGNSKLYIHPFEISSTDKDAVEKVWQEVENASIKASYEAKGKENVGGNKKT